MKTKRIRMTFSVSVETEKLLKEMSERTLISMSKLVELAIKELKK